MNDLPTSVALETIPVSQGVRKGATVELDRDYFEGQRGAIGRTYDEKAANMSDRLQGLRESYDTVVNVKVKIGGIDTETLTEASEELRRKFAETYEAEFLDDNTPDNVEVFVVPEWVRRRGGLSYTARAYFFRDDQTVSPEDIVGKNVESVVSEVRDRVVPRPEEREALERVVADLTARAEAAIEDLPVEADTRLVGSTARGTWLAGDRDIDLFVRFPTDYDRAELERLGLAIGHEVLPEGHEEYAEHPYVTGEFDGFAVDLVPCYAVDSATAIRSAVDRTPFHTRYIDARLDDDLARDIRVFKQFLKGIDAYGSDLRTEGFSGYLAELLVVEYGGIEPLLRAAADWHPPITLDPESHGTESFDDPLTVIDPTDPERNVAAVLSATNLARLQHYARDLLADPREEMFLQSEPTSLDRQAVRAHLADRETTAAAIVFETPDIVEDQLYPQLRKSLSGVVDGLERHEFGVIRSTTLADTDRSVLLIELADTTRPAIERHEGPPVAVRDHAEGFFESYIDDDTIYGPFLDGDRYVVERPRAVTDARQYLDSDAIFEVALGAQIETALADDYELLWDEAVATLADAFGTELAAYFEPTP